MTELKFPDQVPTEEEFRKAGYSKNAVNYPLSEAALRKKAEFNNVPPDTVPATWWYAPNQYMQDYWEGRREI